MEPSFQILDPHSAINLLKYSFETLQLLSPGEQCWTNYLRRGSVISSYGPCSHLGCGSLFKTRVKHTKQLILFEMAVLYSQAASAAGSWAGPGPGPDRLGLKCYLASLGTRVVGGGKGVISCTSNITFHWILQKEC